MKNTRWLAEFLENLISMFLKIEGFFLPTITYILPLFAMVIVSFLFSSAFIVAGFLNSSTLIYFGVFLELLYFFIILLVSYSFLNFVRSNNPQTKFYVILFLFIDLSYLLIIVFGIILLDNGNAVSSSSITTAKILITLLFYINPQVYFVFRILEDYYYKNLNIDAYLKIHPSQVKSLPNKSGIYKIINTKNKKVYVGRTKALKSRLSKHFTELKNGIHSNQFLQKEFNDGFEFEIEILEQFDEYNYFEVVFLEHAYIEKLKSRDKNYGYNLQP